MNNVSANISLQSWILLIAVGVLIFLLNIDYTAVNLTLVPISEEIDADLNTLQWLLSSYVLIWAAFVIPTGRIADLYGKRNSLIGGLLLFMAGSILTGVGNSIEVLILGRILQGFGAAIFTSPAWATIFTVAPPEKQGFVMGIILSFAGFGLAAGPTLAGLIIQEMSWRWIFYINIPLGVGIIAVLLSYGTKDMPEKVQEKINKIGSLLLASGLCLTVYALNQIETWGIRSINFWGVLTLGLGFLSLFVIQDRQQKTQMLPRYFFYNKGFMTAIVGVFFMAINFSMVLVLIGLYLQSTLHYSSYETGLIFIALTISMGLLSPIGGKMIDVLGLKGPMAFGSFCTATGVGLLAFLGTNSSLNHVITALFLVGTGLGAYFTACNIAMMRSVEEKDLNVASGVYTMVMMIGNTLSIILSTSLVVLFGRMHLLTLPHLQDMNLNSEQYQKLVSIISKVEHSVDQFIGFSYDQIPHLMRWIDEAFVHGMSFNMFFGSACAFMVTVLTLWGVTKRTAHNSSTQVAVGI